MLEVGFGEEVTAAASQRKLKLGEIVSMSAYDVPIIEDNPEESRRLLREAKAKAFGKAGD